MADEERVPVPDLGRAYSRYVARSGQPAEWFLRDKHHLNDRGKQGMARFPGDFLMPGAESR